MGRFSTTKYMLLAVRELSEKIKAIFLF